MHTLPTADAVKHALQAHASPGDAAILRRYFKTAPGQYGAGDVFIGVRVPATRAVSRAFATLPLPEIQKLLDSPIHEHRLVALHILVLQMKRCNTDRQAELYAYYRQNLARGRINNWDLIDTSCPLIIGTYLLTQSDPLITLQQLAQSKSLWERRAAIMATLAFIRSGNPEPTLTIAKTLLKDTHDLIHKATGWMLREVGKQCSQQILRGYLDANAAIMPRTALRYAIEHLSPDVRQLYMQRKKPGT